MKEPHVIIVGAGFGGLSCTRALKKTPVRVTLIDKNNHHLFQPLLYQVATAGLTPADIAVPIRSIVRKQKNVTVLMEQVHRIDLNSKQVVLEKGQLSYDYLVLATGAEYHYFGHDEWKTKAPALKTVSDATHIRRMILTAFEIAETQKDENIRKELLTFVIVGGGPTGVELAGAIAELSRKALTQDFRNINPASAKIILSEAAPRILGAFTEKLAQDAQKALLKLGVDVRTGSSVQDIQERGALLAGEFVPTRTILWAAGVKSTTIGTSMNVPIDRQGRVIVEPDLSVLGHSNIFVIGDAAAAKDENGSILPGLAPVAMQEGKYVAQRIGTLLNGTTHVEPFRYVDKGTLATVGRSFAIVQLGKFHRSGFFAWLLWLVVHIYYLIGFRNRILVLIQWAWAYLRFQPGARLIIPPEKR